MARTRTQRRRHLLAVVLAVVATLVVVLFGHDVSRAAHDAIQPRRSENRSFAALANDLISAQNSFDGRLAYVLSKGASLSRPVFAARLNQLDEQLPQWATLATLLHRPVLAHDVNEVLEQITLERVAAYQTLLGDVARALSLPWSSAPATKVQDPVAVLSATSRLWRTKRFSLAGEPGHVRLDQLSNLSATYFAQRGVSALVASSSLALVRGLGIAAIRVSPTPLPAPRGVLLLPPTTSVNVGISVLNSAYDVQGVTLSFRVTPLNGPLHATTQTMHATIGPLGAYAFVPQVISTTPSERAIIVVSVTGAPRAKGMVSSETLRVKISPSGNP